MTALPPAPWRRLMVSCDGAGASHALVTGQAKYVSCVSGPVLDLVVDGTQGAISIESITAVTRFFTPVRRLTLPWLLARRSRFSGRGWRESAPDGDLGHGRRARGADRTERAR